MRETIERPQGSELRRGMRQAYHMMDGDGNGDGSRLVAEWTSKMH